jgi:hypothetical protein
VPFVVKKCFLTFCVSLFFCFYCQYVCLLGLNMYVLMKKILLLLVLGIGLASCTTENEEDFVQYGTVTSQKNNESQAPMRAPSLPSCFTSLTGSVHVDVSNGLGNPIVVFTPTITGTVPYTAKFNVRVEVQPLSDCDDMNSNTGSLLTFGPTGTVQNIIFSPPSVSVLPGNMPICYKWRFVFEGVSSLKTTCYSASVWYESPLF